MHRPINVKITVVRNVTPLEGMGDQCMEQTQDVLQFMFTNVLGIYVSVPVRLA